jgi:hypothetical protein
MADTPTTNKPKGEHCEAIHVHGQTEDGSMHVVGIGNLRVIITNDDGSWFAQGLEIDYATEGATLEAVKHNFVEGLYSTVQQHLQIYGDIKQWLQPAPLEVWQEFFTAASENKFTRQRLTTISIHQLPIIESIEYLQEKSAA